MDTTISIAFITFLKWNRFKKTLFSLLRLPIFSPFLKEHLLSLFCCKNFIFLFILSTLAFKTFSLFLFEITFNSRSHIFIIFQFKYYHSLCHSHPIFNIIFYKSFICSSCSSFYNVHFLFNVSLSLLSFNSLLRFILLHLSLSLSLCPFFLQS